MVSFTTSIVFTCILVTALGLITLSDESSSLDNPFREEFLGQRKSRSTVTTGVAGIRSLLGNARRIFSDGANDVYVKKGGLNDAIKDFYALNPSDVNGIMRYGKEPTSLTGRVENKRIVVVNRSSSITLDISNILLPGRKFATPRAHSTIVYKN